jgi:hypothetical protein
MKTLTFALSKRPRRKKVPALTELFGSIGISLSLGAKPSTISLIAVTLREFNPSMSISQAIGPHLPLLRRYARALTGTQESGDR